MRIRKYFSQLEDVQTEQGRTVGRPVRRVVTAAVLENEYAGRWQEDLSSLYELGRDLGHQLTASALQLLGGQSDLVEAYGKGALVGTSGELEHAAALLHPFFGKAVRSRLMQALAIMPSTVKRAAPGTTLDVPVHNVLDPWSFDHFDAVSFSIADAPHPREIVVALVLTEGGRPLARVQPQPG
jgi:hypothetical protein